MGPPGPLGSEAAHLSYLGLAVPQRRAPTCPSGASSEQRVVQLPLFLRGTHALDRVLLRLDQRTEALQD